MIIDHIGFNVSDFSKTKAFFLQALKPLGISVVMEGEGWAMIGKDDKPQFWFGSFGNIPGPIHIAVAAANRAQVRQFYEAALAAGGKDNGAPGVRENYHPNYYGAFVIGPDGHNIEAVCHQAEAVDTALRASWRPLNGDRFRETSVKTEGKMRALEAKAFSVDALQLVERPIPQPRRDEILVRIRAASLNYRDLAILKGTYLPDLPLPYVPASDACGEVVEVGEEVTRFRVGERVVPIYTQGWHDGLPTPELRAKRTLGAPLSGVLQEYLVVPAEDAVSAPEHLTDVEAATLPIAALSAWSTLLEGGLKAGDVVLVQGTGGVSLFALQFAKVTGAFVIATSSSDAKLARVRELGVDLGINYRTTPDWHVAVRDATKGRGADIIVETGGSTLPKSLSAVAFGGFIGVVGFIAGYEALVSIRQLIGPMVRVQGIAVGSRARFEAMNRAIAQHHLKPVIDKTFTLEKSADGFRRMEAGEHFGKIAVTV